MNWAHYLLQANIYLVVFYGFYKLLLDKETYFVLNRIYLLSAGFLSLSIPFLRIEWFTTQAVAQPVYISVDQINQFVIHAVVIPETNAFSLTNILISLYLLGMLFFALRFIIRLFKVGKLLKTSKKGSAFSFFNKLVVDETLPQADTIIKHEDIHARQLHTADLLFFELLNIFTWFNPVIYFYKNTIRQVHEFLADEEAARFQGDKKQYATLLMSSALGVAPSTLINGFFTKSLLKKRIFMLYKQRSKKTAILKYGLFIPLFAVTLVASSSTIRNNDKIRKIADELPLEQPLTAVKDMVEQTIAAPAEKAQNRITRTGTSSPDHTADQPGEQWKPFYTFLSKSIRYPQAAQEARLQGKSTVKFQISKGEIEGINVASSPLGSGLDAEVMKNILSYKDFSTENDGKYLLTVAFRLDGATTAILNKTPVKVSGYTSLNQIVVTGYPKQNPVNKVAHELSQVNIQPDNNEKTYDATSLETLPGFPGGMDNFYEYILRNARYTPEAKDNRIEGKVFLSFVVNTDGSLDDIKVERGLGAGLDEEAVRVLKNSPRWIPAVRNGTKVPVKYNMPINFSLPGQKGSGDEKIYDFVSLQTPPSFKGGISAFYDYISKNAKYTQEAQQNNIQGKVFLSFVVETDGTLTNIKVERKLGAGLDEEALRLIKASPKWIPGTQDDRPVRVKYNIPISFTRSK